MVDAGGPPGELPRGQKWGALRRWGPTVSTAALPWPVYPGNSRCGLAPSAAVLGMRPLGGDWVMRVEPPQMGFVPYERDSGELPRPSPPAGYEPAKLSPDTQSAVALILDFQPQELCC